MAIHFEDGQEVFLELPGGIFRGIVLNTATEGEYILSIPDEGNPVKRIDGKTKMKIVRE